MTEPTAGPWQNGFKRYSITGPNTPNPSGVTCSEALEISRWRQDCADATLEERSKTWPEPRHRVIFTGMRPLAIVLWGDGISREEAEANAELISSAPEMRERLKKLEEERAQLWRKVEDIHKSAFWEVQMKRDLSEADKAFLSGEAKGAAKVLDLLSSGKG